MTRDTRQHPRGPILGACDRRDFLKHVSVAGLAASAALGPDGARRLSAARVPSQPRACIVLWMQGGPSQFETFSPRPRHAGGGPTKAIPTSVPGMQIAEHFPHLARAMDDVALIRSMTGTQLDHQGASSLLRPGYAARESDRDPALGAVAGARLAEGAAVVPPFVRIGDPPPTARRGRLLAKPNHPRQARSLSAQWTEAISPSGNASPTGVASTHPAWDLDCEDPAVCASYGTSDFGQGCLLARRLVEAGIPLIEVSLGDWDTHVDHFRRSAALAAQVDRPFTQLLMDLKQRGLLDTTLVVWMGEFGRTPRINARGGRDHFPDAFNVALAGGGVRGGQIIGQTDAGGNQVTERPVSTHDLNRSICHALGIAPDSKSLTSEEHPMQVASGGQVVWELFG